MLDPLEAVEELVEAVADELLVLVELRMISAQRAVHARVVDRIGATTGSLIRQVLPVEHLHRASRLRIVPQRIEDAARHLRLLPAELPASLVQLVTPLLIRAS